jgi:hypothetical protein
MKKRGINANTNITVQIAFGIYKLVLSLLWDTI